MTHKDYVLAAINHEQTDRVPYSLGFDDNTDKELDTYCGSTEWRKKLQRFLCHVGSVDANAEQQIDAAHRRDIFGTVWRVDRRPWHLEKPAMAQPRMDAITWPTADQFPKTVVDNVAQLTGPNAEQFSIMDNGWGLFEHSWRLRGFENTLMDCIAEPDFYAALLDKLTELRLGMVAKCADVAADAIMFGDDWGEQRGVIIGPDRWRKLLKPRWAKVFAATHAQKKYAICHSCGSVAAIIPDLIEIGLDVLESVQPEAADMDPFVLKKKFGAKIVFWGCLGSQSTVPFATPKEIRKRVKDLCKVMGKGGGYILAPAKGIQPGTPPENAAAVVEAFATQNL
ncbi:MAG: hypothetical protein NTW87_24680 [Planctomycetota bacterium]|nr:hypothetical protein [Planctomycetota bacterium]